MIKNNDWQFNYPKLDKNSFFAGIRIAVY